MVVNLRAHEISRGARKLVRTPTLIKKKLFISIVTKITFYEIKFIVGLLLEKMEDPPTIT
jgi:hypothetical protein